jgi:hypothetical protein
VDRDPGTAARFAEEMSAALSLDVRRAGSIAETGPRSDIWVT